VKNEAVFGGGPNLKQGLVNVINKYQAKAVGIATTCLTETIGDNVPAIVTGVPERSGAGRFLRRDARPDPRLHPVLRRHPHGGVPRRGEGATVQQPGHRRRVATAGVNLLPGLVSPADIRYLQEVMDGFGLDATLLPDYSRPLDAPASERVRNSARRRHAVGRHTAHGRSPGQLGVLGWTAWIPKARARTCRSAAVYLFIAWACPSGCARATRCSTPWRKSAAKGHARSSTALERGRLLDAMVDGHKYLSGKKAVVYGEQDLVIGLASFLAEIGVQPVLCASGAGGSGLSGKNRNRHQ
jgi:nitrogenase molybdenum-iron protein NifN